MRYGFLRAVREEGVDFEILEGVTLDNDSDRVQAAIEARLARPNPPDGYRSATAGLHPEKMSASSPSRPRTFSPRSAPRFRPSMRISPPPVPRWAG
jgi:hypothetical protein